MREVDRGETKEKFKRMREGKKETDEQEEK
jgi:hypothetical protein